MTAKQRQPSDEELAEYCRKFAKLWLTVLTRAVYASVTGAEPAETPNEADEAIREICALLRRGSKAAHQELAAFLAKAEGTTPAHELSRIRHVNALLAYRPEKAREALAFRRFMEECEAAVGDLQTRDLGEAVRSSEAGAATVMNILDDATNWELRWFAFLTAPPRWRTFVMKRWHTLYALREYLKHLKR